MVVCFFLHSFSKNDKIENEWMYSLWLLFLLNPSSSIFLFFLIISKWLLYFLCFDFFEFLAPSLSMIQSIIYKIFKNYSSSSSISSNSSTFSPGGKINSLGNSIGICKGLKRIYGIFRKSKNKNKL